MCWVSLLLFYFIFFYGSFSLCDMNLSNRKNDVLYRKSMHGHNSDFSNIWVQQGVMQHSVQCWIDCKTISFDAFVKGEKKHKTALRIKAALFYTNSQIEEFSLFFSIVLSDHQYFLLVYRFIFLIIFFLLCCCFTCGGRR